MSVGGFSRQRLIATRERTASQTGTSPYYVGTHSRPSSPPSPFPVLAPGSLSRETTGTISDRDGRVVEVGGVDDGSPRSTGLSRSRHGSRVPDSASINATIL